VAVADVNGDGRPDLVVANKYSGSVSVLLGNGNGTFQAAQNFSVGTGPVAVAVADVNGDGHPDLITANYFSNSVSVLLGNGDGTFGSAVTFGVGTNPYALAVADVNGDGVPDVVTANAQSNYVSVLLGKRNAATHFHISAPATATAGTSFTITVTAKTAGNQLDAAYTGTVHFKSSDGSAVLPPDYTFTLRDAGSHKFKVTLNTTGSQTITVTDTVTSSITGQATVTVNAAAPAPAPAGGSGQGDSAGVDATVAATLLPRTPTLPIADAFVETGAGTQAVPAVWPSAGSPVIAATERARQSQGLAAAPLRTVGWAERVRQPFDPEGDVLTSAGVAAYFAQDAMQRWAEQSIRLTAFTPKEATACLRKNADN
jgi:hypothetical protein